MTPALKAPFPYMGGKSRAADAVWRFLGPNVPNYVEPFAGSLAVLLRRPGGAGKIETVNDLDGGIVNFWRAVTTEPEAVEHWCDWPVSEIDLHARHRWLRARLGEMAEQLRADPDFFDPKAAGWWVWGISQWIGKASGTGGVHGQLPKLGTGGTGIHRLEAPPCAAWFAALSARLRRVRVVCGDWRRVLGPSVTGRDKSCGMYPCAVFLDPPYDLSMRDKDIYGCDEAGVSAAVREWALEHGDDPRLRIAVCGYEGEHDFPGWRVHRWKAHGGYALRNPDNQNKHRERIWLSPHCLAGDVQAELFG